MTLVDLGGWMVNAESITRIGPIIGGSFRVYLNDGESIQLGEVNKDHLAGRRERLINHLTHRRIESF